MISRDLIGIAALVLAVSPVAAQEPMPDLLAHGGVQIPSVASIPGHSLTLDLDAPPVPLGELAVGRDAFAIYHGAGSPTLANGLYTAYFRSPIDAATVPEGFPIGEIFDYADATIEAVPTTMLRLTFPDERLQPYFVVARQTNDIDETLRLGVGVGLRYRLTPQFSVTSDVISFASDSQSRSSVARQSETVWMVRMEWGF